MIAYLFPQNALVRLIIDSINNNELMNNDNEIAHEKKSLKKIMFFMM